MPSESQDELERYGVIVLRRDGSDILLVYDGDHFALPSVAIPLGQRLAEGLTAAIKTEWGEEVICLFDPGILPGSNGTGVRYQVTEHWRSSSRPKLTTRWLSLACLPEDSWIDTVDLSAIRKIVAKCNAKMQDCSVGPFARLGWFRELREWIEGIIKPRGLFLSENFRQMNSSHSFSLIRFETDGPALWFKAVGKPNEKEFPITCTLARLFPKYLPPILGLRPDWNGWLTHEADGRKLEEAHEAPLWKATAMALARLQIESIDHAAGILSVGARDLRPVALASLVQPFIEMMTQLMEEQTKPSPAVLCREELLSLADCIQTALAGLDALEIPLTLGHLDLNPGNIVVSPTRCAFLDWAEAFVGNPLLSFQYFLEHFRRASHAKVGAEARFVVAYVDCWKQVVSGAVIVKALRYVPLLAVFAYAVGNDAWSDRERLADPSIAGYLRSLTRRMHREADQLNNRRSPCLT